MKKINEKAEQQIIRTIYPTGEVHTPGLSSESSPENLPHTVSEAAPPTPTSSPKKARASDITRCQDGG